MRTESELAAERLEAQKAVDTAKRRQNTTQWGIALLSLVILLGIAGLFSQGVLHERHVVSVAVGAALGAMVGVVLAARALSAVLGAVPVVAALSAVPAVTGPVPAVDAWYAWYVVTMLAATETVVALTHLYYRRNEALTVAEAYAASLHDLAVEIDSFSAKDVRVAHQKALKLLRSRVAAARSGMRPSSRVVASYELPDGSPAPDDLVLYRKP